MDEFKLQRSLAHRLLKERPTMSAGMKLVQAELEKNHAAWKKCRGIDWNAGLDKWVGWMDALVQAIPPPPIGLIWFETPSELNAAMTSVSGWSNIGTADDQYGAEEDRVWPVKADGFTAAEGLHDMAELQEALTRAGVGDDEGEADCDLLEPGTFAISYSYTLLLILNGLPRTRFAGEPASPPLAVCTGWAAGDIDKVGGLWKCRWTAFPRARSKRAVAPLSELEMNDLARFSPEKFLARGGSVKWRDPANGGSLLHSACYKKAADIKKFLAAGCDVKAQNLRGESPLWAVGAGEIANIRLLLAAGADVRENHGGRSLLGNLLEDGRCTLEHIKLFVQRGVGPDGVEPLHGLARNNLYDPGRYREIQRMLRYWLRRGKNIEQKDANGDTPLWIALRAHAQELTEHREWLAKNRDNGGDWDYAHDRVAMLFLENGADATARCTTAHPLIPEGGTTLMVRRYDDDRLVRALLDAGADPRAQSAEGKTAFDYASDAATTPDVVGHRAAAKVAALLKRAMTSKGSKSILRKGKK